MKSYHLRRTHGSAYRIGAILMGLALAVPCQALELEGFTEPYRTIEVASDETGLLDEVLVREGQRVEAGQALVRLNSDVFQASLAVAQQACRSQGRLDAARADLALKRLRLANLIPLQAEGHARREEVDRARAEVRMAEANVRTVEEDRLVRELECRKIEAQIARRTIRAPIAGVVKRLARRKGEFVAPNNPNVLTLVELDQLTAVFTVLSPDAVNLKLDQELELRFLASGRTTVGRVEFIAPVTDAESGTVRVKLHVPNKKGEFRSGERCKIHVSRK